MAASDVLNMIKEKDVKFVDFRFTDTQGKEQHVSMPSQIIDEDFLEEGKMFDGSSIQGWKGINASDMILMPDCDTGVIDPFCEEVTMNITCDVIEPTDMTGYNRDPRSIAKRAEAYLQSTGIGDAAYFGPENEFFVFDGVQWGDEMGGVFYKIESEEAAWNTGKDYDGSNMGHRPGVKGGYFPVPPIDSLQDLRSSMCLVAEDMGVKTEVHHHEVGTAGQCEIGVGANTLVKKADEVLLQGVSGITGLITTPGLINVDFADVRTVMSEKGRAMMGSGKATGEDRVRQAAEAAIACPRSSVTPASGFGRAGCRSRRSRAKATPRP